MQKMIDYVRTEGIRTVNGQILRENATMLAMCKELGFQIKPDPDDFDIYVVELPVTGSTA
jgi:acetyltransferase